MSGPVVKMAPPRSSRRLTHCCCFTVRTGSIIIASLGLLFGIICVGYYSFLYDNDDYINQALDVAVQKMEDMALQGQIDPQSLDQFEELVRQAKYVLPKLFIAFITFGCGCVLVHGLLLLGIARRSRFLMLPWLVLRLVGIAASVVICLAYAAVFAAYAGASYCALSLLFSVPCLALDVYLWTCVLSHYIELKEEASREDGASLVGSEVPPSYEYVVSVKQ